jgi:glutathione S-transferase
MIKIYHVTRTRGARIVWLCEEMGLKYETVPVAFPPDDAYKARNPIGSIPFLEDDGGVAMNESIAMMLYLTERYGPTPLLPKNDPLALSRTLQFALLGEATMGSWMNVMIGSQLFAPEGEKDNWSARGAAERIETSVNFVADRLKSDPYLAGQAFTVADISVSYVLGLWTAFLGGNLPPALQQYQARIAERPAFQKAMAA